MAPNTVMRPLFDDDTAPLFAPVGVSASDAAVLADDAAPSDPAASSIGHAAGSGLTINVVYNSSVAFAPAAFKVTVAAAVAFLESQFSIPLTLTIDVGFGEVNGSPMDAGSDGESESFSAPTVTYQTLRSALIARTATADEIAAGASLPVSDPTHGGGFVVSVAEAEALGLPTGQSATRPVGAIGLSSTTSFTYGTTNQAKSGTTDAFGVIEHEITEVMGRTESLGTDGSHTFTPLDLFRYASPGVRDLTPGPGSFSINGSTLLDQFNNPTANDGDAGDWSTNVPDDSFDAFASSGVANPVSATDLREMDVLGYTPANIPAATVVSAAASAASGNLTTGGQVTLTINMSVSVTVSGGTPTLALNDGGTASYVFGSDTTQLIFDYTVAAGQNTLDLALAASNALALNGASISNAAGAASNLSGANGLTFPVTLTINKASAASDAIVDNDYQSLLRVTPGAALAQSVGAELDDGALTAGQLETQLLDEAQSSTVPALVTFDLMYQKTPNSAGLTFLATYADDLESGNYTYNAAGQFESGTTGGEFSSLPFSLQNVYVNLGATFADDPASAFAASYAGLDRASFVNQVYTEIFGTAPGSATQQFLLNSFPFYLSYAGSEMGARGSIAGVLLSLAVQDNAGADPAAANAFLQAAVSGTVTYGPELTAEFPAKGPVSSTLGGMAADAAGDSITVTSSNQLIDPGSGSHTIRFLTGAGDDTLVLHADGSDLIAGFDPGSDVLDLRALLSAASVNVPAAALGQYVTVTSQNGDAVIGFDPTGHASGATIAVLQGLGNDPGGLSDWLARGAIRTA